MDRLKLYQLQGGKCFYCLSRMDHPLGAPPSYDNPPTRDHLRPKSLGYGDCDNIVLACEECNYEKNNRMPSNIEIAIYNIGIRDGLGLTYARDYVINNHVKHLTRVK